MESNQGVHVYADESGHSGKDIFNNESPLYYQGAVISVGEIESVTQPIIDKFCNNYGVDRLHGNELGEEKIDEICKQLLIALNGSDWQFHYTIIQKSYIAPTKFVDTVFDSFDNPAVHPLWYTTELFRHTLAVIVDDMMDVELAYKFWYFYLSDDIYGLISIAKTLLERAPDILDPRCEEVITEGLSYAVEHPEIFTLISAKGKSAYKKQTPNMVAFSSLLTATHRFCNSRDLGVTELIHDQSDEFRGTMREYHRIFFGVDIEDDKFGSIPKFKEVEYNLGEFKIKSSKNSYGLQVADLFLWLIQRDIKNDSLQCTKDKIIENADDFIISREMSMAVIAARHYQLIQEDVTSEQIEASKILNQKIESNMNERMKK